MQNKDQRENEKQRQNTPCTARIRRRTQESQKVPEIELFADDFADDFADECEDADVKKPQKTQSISQLEELLSQELQNVPEQTPMRQLEELLMQGDAGEKKEKKPEKFKRPRKKKPFSFKKIFTLKRIVLAMLAMFFLAAVGAGFFFVHTTRNDNLWLDLDTMPYRTQTLLYYTDEEQNQQIYFAIPCTQNKEYVSGEKIPQHLRDAFIAVEDQKFYTHKGFDFKRTVFAVLNESAHALTGQYIGGETGRKQGASTITQQLIKNLTRDDADSDMSGYLRKLRELCRAIRLDYIYEKDEIINAYLNTISFTGNTAGVQAEAKKLFGVDVSQLSIAQAASIAAITRNPSRFNPALNPQQHTQRRNYVLSQMLYMGKITQQQHDEAVGTPLEILDIPEPKKPEYVTDYFTDTVIESVISQLCSRFNLTRKEASHLLYNGGLRIHTTVQPKLQEVMENIMQGANYHQGPAITAVKQLTNPDGTPAVDENGKPVFGDVKVGPQAAMISLDYSGGIAAVVGGLGQKEISRGFNRATQAVRQVGSTMKPIAPYVTALEDDKITWSTAFLDDVVMPLKDKETGIEADWPRNVDNQYSQRQILVREGLSRSVNTIAVRVGQAAGVQRMYTFVTKQLGISTFTRQDKDLAPLVLGSSTYGISPLEMAMAYAIFGNGGYAVSPHSYTQVTSGTGKLVFAADTEKKRVISPETAFIMNRLLKNVLTDGTAAGFSVQGEMESVGKTGTTTDNRDHWFIGLTPYYVTASWYGYDENQPLLVDSRNHPPTLAWRAAMQKAQQNLPPLQFAQSQGVQQQSYCTKSGGVAGANCPAANGWYKIAAPLKVNCHLH